MEVVGIALYALGGLVAAPVFCFLLARYARRFVSLSALLWRGSVGLLMLFILDLASYYFFGCVRARAAVGPIYFPMHALVTLLAAPAAACVLLLGRRSISRWWPAVAVVAWCIGVFAIFHQYNVSEALYGVDGVGGPYSD
ncbi:MAG TPA: hypothetical protein VGM84_15295 [Steroidobacteraceae bacterium]|jgi:hypothetical protein